MAGITWYEDLTSAFKVAQREHKHVLLDFHNPL